MSDGRRQFGWTRALALLCLAAALAGGVYLLQSWRRAPAPAPAPSTTPSTTPSAQARPFARWLQFERLDDATRAALGENYVDAMLGHQVFRVPPPGVPPMLARGLLLDDDALLLPSGRRLWNRELAHQPGLAGLFCYVHSTYCVRRLFDVTFTIDSTPVVIYDNQYRIERFPSHTTVRYALPGIRIDEQKFITYDDQAIAAYQLQSRDERAHDVTIEVISPFPPIPNSDDAGSGYPLMGKGELMGMPLLLYLTAPGFERVDTPTVHLRRTVHLPASGEPVSAWVAYRFANTTDTRTLPPDAPSPFDEHVRTYNRWFADNVPYFDASDPAFKKMWLYRWWIVRFHLTEPQTPDLAHYAFYEGKLGFDNVIGFAVPAQLKELTYLRDPAYGLAQIESSYRNLSPEGAVIDAPGSPYWGETYSHWIPMAVAEFDRVHPIPPPTLRALLPAMARDVRAWLSAYDRDGDALPERDRPRVTGYDLDILSYWYFNGTKLSADAQPPPLERVDFASFVFANARALAELAAAVDETALAQEFAQTADRVRTATLTHLWDDDTQFFYPRHATDDRRIPIRELHGFFPFTTLLAPNEPRYTAALRHFVDPAEFWAAYPPVITSLAHYRTWTWDMDGLTRNIAPHPISMGARTLIQALKAYDNTGVTPDHFMELMARYTDLMYPRVRPGDALWRPNAHEYYSQWEPHRMSPVPKPSDISHDFHSMYCALIVEGAVGLTPRRDARIELQPMARRWSYFMLDGLRYREHDLTVVWDQPDGSVRYPGFPEGFSLAIDGQLAFNRPQLAHVVYDPHSGTLEVPAE